MSEDPTDDKIVQLHGHEDEALEALYRQAERPEPPARLDAVIRQAARTAPASHAQRSYPWVAGIVTSVLAAILLYQLYPGSLPHPPRPAGKQVAPSVLPADQTGNRLQRSAPADKAERAAPATESPAPAVPPQPHYDMLLQEMRKAPPAAAHHPPLPGVPESSTPGTQPSQHRAGPGTGPGHAPEQELASIVGLLSQGKTAAARTAWLAFRRRYPGYDIARHVPAETARRLEALAP